MEYMTRRCVGVSVEECGMDVMSTCSEKHTPALLRLDDDEEEEEVVVE